MPLLPMTTNSSLTECIDDRSYYHRPLFADAISLCPAPKTHHSNEAPTSRIREVTNKRQNQSTEGKMIPQLSQFLLSARDLSLFFHLPAIISNYDFLLITKTWLNNDTPEDAAAFLGYQSFRKRHPSQHERSSLVCVQNSKTT